MKKLLLYVIASAALLCSIGCGSVPAGMEAQSPLAGTPAGMEAQSPLADTAAGIETQSPLAGTAATGGTKTVYDTAPYAYMTEEELYAAALAEEGKLVVYTETNSTSKSLDGFLEKYPGIEVEVNKYKNYIIDSKIEFECASGNLYADVVIGGDSSGVKYNEWYDNGYVVCYVPEGTADDLYAEYLLNGLPVTIECAVWYYSNTLYPDGCPIKNWWDIVETDDSGNGLYRLYLNDVTNESTCALLSNLIDRADEMAAAYREKYGTDLVCTYDASELGIEPDNAGFEWLYRFLQCDYTVINDSAEIITAVDASKEPALGLSTTLKYGDARSAGENVSFTRDLTPFNGFAKVKYLYIVRDSAHPAKARLFAAYTLKDGYAMYADRNGVYGTRYSHDDSTHSDIPFAQLHILPSNSAFVYENAQIVRDFWTMNAARFAR